MEIPQASELEIDETLIDYQDPGHESVSEGRLRATDRSPGCLTDYPADWPVHGCWL